VTVDDVVIAFSADFRLDVGGIRGCHRGLSHQVSGADLARQQWLEPALLLLRGSVALEQLHVARIRRTAVEHFGREIHPPHDLAERRILEVLEPAAVRTFR